MGAHVVAHERAAGRAQGLPKVEKGCPLTLLAQITNRAQSFGRAAIRLARLMLSRRRNIFALARRRWVSRRGAMGRNELPL